MPTTSVTRPPAVAGLFYPGAAGELRHEIDIFLAAAHPPPLRPKALIAPHAGYIYSGPIAAQGYALLKPLAGTIQRVVLFGPAHRVPLRGLGVPTAEAFATPLGLVPLDRAAIDQALDLPQVQINDLSHAPEHALEVQLPFLQAVLGEFALVPFTVGLCSASDVAEVMLTLWGGEETLIVVSSDLSHYHSYHEAQCLDRQTTESLLQLHTLDDHEQACGATPINGLILAARQHRLQPHLLDLRNSGDTAGDRSRVVGYLAMAWVEEKSNELTRH